VGFFCLTADVQLDPFLHHTPKLRIPVEFVQFLLKLLLKHISCRVPRFPLILIAKFHPRYVKESEILLRSESELFESRSRELESEILERSESDILPPTPQPWFPTKIFKRA